MNYITWLWRYSYGIRKNTVVRIMTGILQVALGLLTVWLSRRFIDETIHSDSSQAVVRMILLLVATVVGAIVLRQCYYYLTTTASIRQANALRLKMFSGLFRRRLYDERELHSGDVASRLAKDIETVSDVTATTLPQIAVTAIQLCGAFLLMRMFDTRLAWALLMLTPLAIVFGKLIARRLRQMTLDIRQDESRIQMHVQEGMEHNAVLRSLGSEQWMTDRLDTMQQRLRGNVMRRTRFTIAARIILGTTFGLGYLLAFVWGGLGLRNGTITFGVMTSFLQLVSMIQSPILQLLNMVPQVIHATASIDRLEEISEQTEEQPSASEAPIPTEGLGVRLSNVSFRYATGDRAILTQFTHDFRPGTRTVIVGETGIGKTTLFRLLLGFVEPAEGSVSIYGETGEQPVDSRTRRHFVFVPQGNTLMSGSIRYNLLLANPEADEATLLEALHTACADFVTELPEGLDYELGERGSGLSEGQAQRIAIARALLRPGAILLLDEISSSLDEQTERELFRRLFLHCPHKTIILISHRTAVASQCDEMLTLQQ